MTEGVSIVVPIYNRADSIVGTLNSIECQRFSGDMEIIVVDDGSTDSSIPLVNQFGTNSHQPISLIQHPNLGPGAARNAGAECAKFEVLLFLDADIVAEPDLVFHHIRIQDDQGPGLVAGARRFWPEALTTRFSQVLHGYDLDRDQFWQGNPTFQEFFTSNCSVTKEIFDALGGFDESLRAYEDLDFAYRGLKSGFKILFCRGAVGYHNHAMTFEEACRQQRNYQKAAARFLSKNPELRDKVPALLEKTPIIWGTDSPVLVARKLARRGLSLKPLLEIMKKMVMAVESRSINRGVMLKLYWLVLGGYQVRGYREGLRDC